MAPERFAQEQKVGEELFEREPLPLPELRQRAREGELRGVEHCSPRTHEAFGLVRERVAFLDGDRYLDEDIASVVDLIQSGALSAVVRA